MDYLNIKNNVFWVMLDDESDSLLFVFENKEDAISKIADYEEVPSVKIVKFSRKDAEWAISNLSWRNVAFDLIKKAPRP
jgi:hypothetical protein